MDLARWILIVYPVAGLAELLAGIDRRRPPAPAIALVDGAALRADRRIHKLQSSLIGIVNALVDEAVATLWLAGEHLARSCFLLQRTEYEQDNDPCLLCRL